MAGRLTAVAAILALLGALASCSDKHAAPSEPVLAPLKLDLLPLAQGTVWTYSFYLMDSYTRNEPDGRHITIETSFGHLELSVPHEYSGGFTRSWLLDSQLEVDSVRMENFLNYELESVTLSDNPDTYSRSYSIFFERDTLWYSENGLLHYMMPGRFVPGGTINLKIFNFPGTDFFLDPLPFNSRWASGDLIYLRQNSSEQSAVKIGGSEGILGVWASSRELIGINLGNYLERELRFTLIDQSNTSL